jgi:hypothetical protein
MPLVAGATWIAIRATRANLRRGFPFLTGAALRWAGPCGLWLSEFDVVAVVTGQVREEKSEEDN